MRQVLSALAVVLLGAPVAAPRPATAQQTITCSSKESRYTYCRATTRGRVRLLQTLSDTDCRYGRTWGFDERGIWVDRGCRGRFEVGGSGAGWESGDWGRTIRCESERGRYERCPVDTYGDVRLARQLSRADCIPGRTWGYQRREIWVTDGCRAEFEVGYGDVEWDGGARRLTCESNDNRYRRCRATTYGSVRIVRQLSKTDCRLNRNWGYDRSGVWVDDGCRAVFDVGTAGGGSWRPLPEQWGGSGGTSSANLQQRARDACQAEARRERFTVEGVNAFRPNDDGGRLEMSLRRDGRNYRSAWCQYRSASGRATVYSGQ